MINFKLFVRNIVRDRERVMCTDRADFDVTIRADGVLNKTIRLYTSKICIMMITTAKNHDNNNNKTSRRP